MGSVWDRRSYRPGEVARYGRHLPLPGIGLAGQERLHGARVLCVGAGGIGSPVVAYLAAAGVGDIAIVDDDAVALTNLQRQIIHREQDVGVAKVDSAKRFVHALNSTVTVRPLRRRVSESTVAETLAGYDVVVDGSDNFLTRYCVSDYCADEGIPLVWGSVYLFDGQLSVFTDGYELRDIHPAPPPPGTVPSCAEAGVFGATPGIVGTMMAAEVIKLVTGAGNPLIGRLAVWHGLEARLSCVPFSHSPLSESRRHGTTDERCSTAIGRNEQFDARDDLCVAAPGLVVTSRTRQTVDHIDRKETAMSTEKPTLIHHPISEVSELTKRGAVLVDVREPMEWETGIIDGATCVALSDIANGDMGALAGLERDTPLALYCKAGARSEKAANILLDKGFTNVTTLDGGILAWWENHA